MILVDRLADPLHDLAAVLAAAHHHDAADHLAPAVARDRTLAQLGAVAHVGHVSHEHWNAACARPDHRPPDIIQAPDLADTAKDVLLGLMLEVATGRHRVVGLDGLDHVVQRQAEHDEALRRRSSL